MPYVDQETRKRFNSLTHMDLLDVIGKGCKSPGDLNYAITRIVNGYIEKRGLSYTVGNEAIGVLECAKLELYRRVLSPYENIKQRENGDVYTTGQS